MTRRMTEVEVQIVNHCGFGDDHRGAVTGQQLGNNRAPWMFCCSKNGLVRAFSCAGAQIVPF